MKRVIPYRTQRNALAALDNGGRFYNVFTQSADGEVSTSELAKVAGVFADKQKMFLYLDMALARLDEDDVKAVRGALSGDLLLAYKRYKPMHCTPALATARGRPGRSAIVTGIPHYVKTNADFTGFIMVPMNTGKTTTFIMVPIVDRYDVYEVHDLETVDRFLVAHARRAKRLDRTPTTFGGILKELQAKKKAKPRYTMYLETVYYSPAYA